MLRSVAKIHNSSLHELMDWCGCHVVLSSLRDVVRLVLLSLRDFVLGSLRDVVLWCCRAVVCASGQLLAAPYTTCNQLRTKLTALTKSSES
jgi:hypothetical protein